MGWLNILAWRVSLVEVRSVRVSIYLGWGGGGVGGGKGRGEVRPRLARPSVIIFFFSWQHYYLRWSPANTELEWYNKIESDDRDRLIS